MEKVEKAPFSRCLFSISVLLFEKSVAVAVPVEESVAPELKTGLGISFRIQLDHLNPVTGDKGNEGNVVLFCHRVADGYKMLVFHRLNLKGMFLLRILRLHWWLSLQKP